MLTTGLKKHRVLRSSKRTRQKGGFVFLLLMLAFLAGSVIGAALGVNSSSESVYSVVEGITTRSTWSYGFLESLWNCSKFIIAVFFLAGSVYGMLLIPVLCAVRGYFLGCSAASIISAMEANGWLLSFFVVGIPAILTVPCLIVLGADAFVSSRKLLSLSLGSYGGGTGSDLARHGIICSAIIVFTAAVNEFLIPVLAGLIL